MIGVRQIKVPLSSNDMKKAIAQKLHIEQKDILSYQILKKSLDARKKPNLFWIYECSVEVEQEEKFLGHKDVYRLKKDPYQATLSGTHPLLHPIVVVGSGPAGLFATYLLALHHYPVILIERGEKMEERIHSVEQFFKEGILNLSSNVQFGEGGAGTFSDGKLNTLIKDPKGRIPFVYETLVKFGAPKEILYEQKPHIGTDLLRKVIVNMREEMIRLGVQIRYQTTLTDIVVKDSMLCGIEVNHQETIDTHVLVLATGHSARDTFSMLYEKKMKMTPKPFAVGLRIQHPQEMINQSQYGTSSSLLGAASYKLTYTSSRKRGVYTFCMCPGGFVVNASSEKKRLAINGMSNYKREAENANSAILVTITPDDFGYHPLDGVVYQQQLEEKAYQLGKGKIPVQLVEDYQKNRVSTSFGGVNPIMKGEYAFANLNLLFPDEINHSIQEAILHFGKKIKGFDRRDAILAGVESRSSSPLRMERDDTLQSNIQGIYPCGEGAGYAGGITSASVDGMRVFEAIASTYQTKK